MNKIATRQGTAAERLTDLLKHVKPTGENKWVALCPSHDDGSPSLSVTAVPGRALVYCHAGCDSHDIVSAVGLTMSDLFDSPQELEYRYDNGRTARRSYDDGGKKTFRQSGTSKAPELYQLSRVRQTVAAGDPVLVCEGEEDVRAASFYGITATTAPQGAGNWAKVDYSPLIGADVLVIVDNDDAGMKRGRELVPHLKKIGARAVHALKSAHGNDLADHVAAGAAFGDLLPVDYTPDAPQKQLKLKSASDARVTGRIVTLTPASGIRIERKRELWESQIMLAVPHLMAGMGGVGKSTFTCHIAAQITRGTLEGDLYGKPANVMIINTEDSPAMVKARMLAAGADLERVFIVSTKFCDEAGELTETTPKLRQDVEQLEELMLEHNVLLLIADPLATVIEGDTNAGTDVRATIDPMIRLAHNTGATVLIVSHFNKGSGTASNKISGSHAIRDAVRGAHVFAKDEDEGVTVLTLDKNNYSQEVGKSQAFRLETRTVPTDDGEEMEVPVVVMLGETDTSVTELINRSVGGGDDTEDRNAAQAFIVDYLMSQPGYEANAADVLKAGRQSGFNELEIKNARRRCKGPKIASDKSGFGSGWVWMISPDHHEGVTKVSKVSAPARVTPWTPSVMPSRKPDVVAVTPLAEFDTPFDIFDDLQGSL